MDRESQINSLQADLLSMVADHLTPVALRCGYSDVPLETNIKWRPQVLVIGNYSSGKSTLINEFLGAAIQATGQAPTDDSFTIITYDDSAPKGSSVYVTEERDGNYLLNDPEYPFEILKKYGEKFASHFRLKKVNSPFLKNLAIIDTPGMLDTIFERDRGYNYQEVIGDLSQLADLVVVLFDPHKAGTVRELQTILKDIIPNRTFDDRVIFALNRIDECSSLIDLLQVYGTLCWNLSQMTVRKDIPMIRLTYSPHAKAAYSNVSDSNTSYLRHLDNQREEVREAVLDAPRHRLDHLATFVETHGRRLSHLLEALLTYRKKRSAFRAKYTLIGFIISMLCGGASVFALNMNKTFAGIDQQTLFSGGAAVALTILVLWLIILTKYFTPVFHKKCLKNLDTLTVIKNQTHRDSWEAIRNIAKNYLTKTGGRFLLKKEFADVRRVCDKGSQEIRETMKELSTIRHDEHIKAPNPN
ncbi:MAG: dynamin family protein [Proteobacteria bacterium]|nr:dynamin family protein [Pseudomonadota bacterium]MBU4067130.1 dynamin family protein [Pseudomonadota bacterium]MBU4101719.1 dynamin family protein [Pseudomonadota bacterium]